MKTILADGQCHYSMYVQTTPGQGRQVVDALKSWKDDVRAQKNFGVDSVEDLCYRVRELAGVTQFTAAGPRSSLPLALRMACNLTGSKGIFTTHMGTGIVSNAIHRELQEANIELQVLHELNGDMPVAFLVIDPEHPCKHETVTLYPLSRSVYRHRSTFPRERIAAADALLLNRVNQGLLNAAHQIRDAGGLNSLRIHGYSRHVRFDDFRPLLPLVDHLVVDSNRNVLRDTSRDLDLDLPRSWLAADPFNFEVLEKVARGIDAVVGRPLLQAYLINEQSTLCLVGQAGKVSVTLTPTPPPGRCCDLRLTSRVHGALAAAVLLNLKAFDFNPVTRQPRTVEGLKKLADWVFCAAHHGILNIPWEWPSDEFNPLEMSMEVI